MPASKIPGKLSSEQCSWHYIISSMLPGNLGALFEEDGSGGQRFWTWLMQWHLEPLISDVRVGALVKRIGILSGSVYLRTTPFKLALKQPHSLDSDITCKPAMVPPFAPNSSTAESQTHNEKLHGWFCNNGWLRQTNVCADSDSSTKVASQQHDTAASDTSAKLKSNKSPAPDSKNHYSQYYQPNSLVWELYLKETEAEDKEVAQLWQIGLDQLLIFVCQSLLSIPYIWSF